MSYYESPSYLAQKQSKRTQNIIRVKKEQLYSLEGLTEDDFDYDPMEPNNPTQAVLIGTNPNSDALSNTNFSQNTPSAVSISSGTLPSVTQNSTETTPTITLQPKPSITLNAAMQGIDMVIFHGESIAGEHDLNLLKEVAGKLTSFHTDIIPHVPEELLANVVVSRNQHEVEYGIGVPTNPVHNFLTPLTRSVFGKVFENVGITRMEDASMMITKNHKGESCPMAAPFHLVFIPIPAVNKKPSTVNIMGQHEFDDNGVYFQNFRKNHVEYRNPNNLTSWLNLAVKVPECLFGDNQRIAHTKGLTNLTSSGPMIRKEYMYMTLYGAYCHSF